MQKILGLFIRYLGAGFIATLVHLLVFACTLHYLGPVISTIFGGFSGAITAYCLSRHWVFAQRHCNTRRFSIIASSQVISNTLVVALLTQWGVSPHLAQLTATVSVTAQGFMFNHLWVFKHDIKRKPFQ